ncbi:MAG: putative metal-dependent hydrolase YcfH, partial [Chlamydiae bacterium]|nr:putative metal-dependent hydrolase YcfH [Chlamydiota bacterium]
MAPPFKLTDSHAHLLSLEGDLELVLARAQEAGVTKILNICTTAKELQKGLALQKKHPWISTAGAITPHDVAKLGEKEFADFAKGAKSGSLVAIGETGLDYHYDYSPREVQQDFLRRYIALAQECSLPLIFHCREAFDDLFAIVDESGFTGPAVLHCFTGTLEEAKQVIERGWYLSLSGIVTFKKSLELREVAKFVPLSQLLIETDSPYLAPQSHRGKP